MKMMPMHVLRLAAILALALSGCALGGKLDATPTPEPSQMAAAPTTGTTPTLSGRPVTAVPTTKAVSATPTADTQGADLLKMIGTLDAANQAGDPLDNLP